MILDTTFIIDLMNGLPQAIEKVKSLDKAKEVQFVASPTIFELYSGIAQSKKSDEEKKRVFAVLGSQTILGLDKISAEEAGKIEGTLVKQGMQIEPEDCMIAGIAVNYGESILTRNILHFSRIKKLKVETY